MKLEKFPAVEAARMTPHLSDMRKIYHFKGVNSLPVTVTFSGCKGSWSAYIGKKAARRLVLSGAQTLTLFPTMSDLKSRVEYGSVRSSWERVGEHLRQAIEGEARRVAKQKAVSTQRQVRAHIGREDRPHHAA